MAYVSVHTHRQTLVVLALVLAVTWGQQQQHAESESCFCNELACKPLNCSRVVPDRCGCCMTCVRGLHETCGGKTRDLGVCEEGLQCVIQAQPGDIITGHEHGTCQELPQGCDAAACDSVITHRCPVDSVLVYNGTHESDQCCKTMTECRCDMRQCKIPQCATGHLPQITRHSTGRPGSCCNHYQCKISGCWSSEGEVYKAGETWKEGDCVTCVCVDGKKQCQAEMCVKTCLKPKYVPGRCCPICDVPKQFPNQSSSCPDLSTCNISCKTGLQQTPDGCIVCRCKPDGCYKDCQFGYMYDEFGEETCECHKYPSECPALPSCSRKCSHGYKLSRKGCPKCRCNKCEPHKCDTTCSHGYKRDKNGCKGCQCHVSIYDVMWDRNCTVQDQVYQTGHTWVGDNCTVCLCKPDGIPTCKQILCPVLTCPYLVKDKDHCCPTCLKSPNSDGRPMDAANSDSATLQEMEEKYVIALSVVGACVMILLILVFVLLYLKLKQRHQASWSVAGQDTYCKCPLFLSHSPTLQHKYNINADIPKYGYDTVVVQKYNHPCVEADPLEGKKFLPESPKEADFLNEREGSGLKSNYYKDWVDM